MNFTLKLQPGEKNVDKDFRTVGVEGKTVGGHEDFI